MPEIIETENSQDELASDDAFLLYESLKKKLNSTLKSIGVSPVNIHGVAQHSHASNAEDKLKKVLNVYKENISATYNVSNTEIEEPPPIYDRGTKNTAMTVCSYEGEISHRFIYRKIANIDFGS